MSLKIFRHGTHSLKPLQENFCSGFLHPKKIHRLQLGLNPRPIGLEVRKLPRDQQGQLPNNSHDYRRNHLILVFLLKFTVLYVVSKRTCV